MKKILLTQLLFLLINAVFAQSPDYFNYQVVVRNSSGELIQNQDIGFQFTILEGSALGDPVFIETHLNQSNGFGLCNLKIGDGTPVSGSIDSINWGSNSYFLKVELDQAGGSSYVDMGTFELLSVPFALHANTASNLGSENIYIPQPDTLFAVKDHEGNVVFAVFPDGVKVIVEESSKGTVGGFAVSGRSPTKAGETDIFRVTPDSTRIYVNDTVQAKGTVGGFAVSGRSPTKGINENYFVVTNDSTRVYINDTIQSKGRVGGFAVSGRSPTKGFGNDYFISTPDSTRIYVNDSSMAKGRVGGFAVSGRSPTKGTLDPIFTSNSDNTRIFTRDTIAGFGVKNSKDGIQTSYMQLNPNNYFIGHDIASNLTTGVRNSIFGYKAGNGLKQGNDNIFIGNEAGYTTGSGSTAASDNIFIGNGAGYNTGAGVVGGNQNVFIGNRAGYNSTLCVRNVFIGFEAGYANTTKNYNTYIGDLAGTKGTGEHNTVIGAHAVSNNDFGSGNVVLGYVAGRDMVSANNVFIGKGAGYNNSSTAGGNVFIGPYAGEFIPTEDNRLVISSWRNISIPPLIYGEFDNRKLIIDNKLGIGIDPDSNTLSVNGTMKLGTNGSTINNIIRHTYTTSVGTGDIDAYASYTFPSFTVIGATTGATVSVSPGSDLPDGIVISYARVTAADTVIIKIQNATNGILSISSSVDWYLTITQ